jgi:hypothetical protein
LAPQVGVEPTPKTFGAFRATVARRHASCRGSGPAICNKGPTFTLSTDNPTEVCITHRHARVVFGTHRENRTHLNHLIRMAHSTRLADAYVAASDRHQTVRRIAMTVDRVYLASRVGIEPTPLRVRTSCTTVVLPAHELLAHHLGVEPRSCPSQGHILSIERATRGWRVR